MKFADEIRDGGNLLTLDGKGKKAKQETLDRWADLVEEMVAAVRHEAEYLRRANLKEQIVEIADRLDALLKGV